MLLASSLHLCVSGKTRLLGPGSGTVGTPENLLATLGDAGVPELQLGRQALEGCLLQGAVSPDGGSSDLRIAGCPMWDGESASLEKGAES